MKKAIYSAAIILILGAGIQAEQGNSQTPAFAELKRMFDYDAKAALDVQEVGVEKRDGVIVKDITYASPKGGRVPAILIMPEKKGKYPAILFGHWGPGNRHEFVAEATMYAQAGVVSVMIDYPWVRPRQWYKPAFVLDKPEENRDTYIQAVVDLRRGIDLLASLAEVDQTRIGYVGHSYGAQWGAILAAVDKRMKTCVLMGGTPDYKALYIENDDPDTVDYRNSLPKDKFEKYMEVISVVSAINFVGQAAPIPLFFQFAKYEQYFKEPAMRRYFQAASEPKVEKWYYTNHDLADIQALIDRGEWLRKYLGFQPIVPLIEKKLKR
jgi:dienelactone hydrolase